DALSFVTKTEQGETTLDRGVYQLYMISNNVTDMTNPEMAEGTYKDVELNNEVTIINRENPKGIKTNKVKAYGKVRIPINEVASDPDTNDKLLLYAEEGNSDYNVMLFNGAVMPKKDKSDYVYSNGYFTVEVSPDYSWFTIECKTYNPNSDEDILSFYVRDDGNNVIENRIGIQIRINTLYSSITNDAQMTSNAVTQKKFVRRYISSVNVKSYDDYSGLSVDLPEDEKELAKIKNVDSTFQFLNYAGMPTVSVDQTDKSAKPMNDPDVVLNNSNLNYELRIYAFMDNVGEDASEFEALSLDKISELFDLDPDTVNTKVIALRSNGTEMNKYLIAGSFARGIAVDGVNRSLILIIQL
ncbi:MAG: hypothetical protein K2L88_02665, partial [Clostridiales bacterium]|nr:hypothetical protein [Clostridiales bacterium]